MPMPGKSVRWRNASSTIHKLTVRELRLKEIVISPRHLSNSLRQVIPFLLIEFDESPLVCL